ncbi:MAG TPA: ABC transporter permease, partial [Candidatus Eisenbergiella stercorigallinarum]|nr:ABC transporter permease [Candidatus Eisenbergiella stercorigallinarum]
VLREQFGVEDPHELVHFLPASLWEKIGETLGETETDLTIRVLAEEGASMETLDSLEEEINGLLEGYETESENRLRARLESDRAYDALMTLFGSFCALLALFGISSVFLNTLSFVRQRRREVARYLSVGMTPCSVGKMFFVEALVLAGRPALVTLPLAALIVAWFLKTSYLDAGLFIRHAPVVPVLLFLAAIFAFVGLAYYLGARKLLRCSLTELLRDESAV